MRTVYFTNIHTGSGQRSQYIYCEVRDAHSDELIMSATMDYAAENCTYHRYTVVPAFIGVPA